MRQVVKKTSILIDDLASRVERLEKLYEKKLYRLEDGVCVDLNNFVLFGIEDIPRGVFKVCGYDKNQVAWVFKTFRNNREPALNFLNEITEIWKG